MSVDKLQEKIRKLKNPSMVEFAIDLEKLPPHLLEQEQSEILACDRYFRELMDGLKDLVPAVRFSMGSFSHFGPDGLFLLSRMTTYAKKLGYYVLLDVPEVYSVQSAQQAAKQLFSSNCLWQFDALAVSPYGGSDMLKPYIQGIKDSGKALFIVLRSPNKSAAELQDLLTGSRLVHMAAADIVRRLGEPLIGRSGYSQIAGMGPATVSDVLKKLRDRHKNLFLLVDGYDYSNANAKNCSYAFDRLGHGAVVCSGSAVTAAWTELPACSTDFVKLSVEAATRMKKNLTRYVTIL